MKFRKVELSTSAIHMLCPCVMSSSSAITGFQAHRIVNETPSQLAGVVCAGLRVDVAVVVGLLVLVLLTLL